MMNYISHNMTGKTLGFAAFRVDFWTAAWMVANGVAFLAMTWVVMNRPVWLLMG